MFDDEGNVITEGTGLLKDKGTRYEVVRTEGHDHERRYLVEVYFKDKPLGQGSGNSKKLAEEAAARIALETLKSQPSV
jgi:ribonuclease-3